MPTEAEITAEIYPENANPHVIYARNGWYHYTCTGGFSAGGSWERRPKKCAGLFCGRDLVEFTVLDEYRAADRQLIEKLAEALRYCADHARPAVCQDVAREALALVKERK